MLKIKNWEKFQHFSNRKPIWIKLYREILDDPNWHQLDGDSAKFLTMLWLLSSENKGYLPDIKTISFRFRISENHAKTQLAKLNQWVEGDDINMISTVYQDDIAEKRREEKEKRRHAHEKEVSVLSFEALEPNWREWAKKEKGWSDSVVEDVWADFREYWTIGKGRGTKRGDWFLSWKNLVRSSKIPPSEIKKEGKVWNSF